MPIQMSPIIDSRVAEQIVGMAPSHRTAVNCHPDRRRRVEAFDSSSLPKEGSRRAKRTHDE
jgi:hypothetical protein